MKRAALAAAVLLASCTPTDRSEPPPPDPTVGPTATTAAIPPDVVVIAGQGSPEADGIRLGATGSGMTARFVDPDGDPEAALREAVASRPAAVVIVHAAGAVVGARGDIEAAAVPVIEVGSDLYSHRALFRYAFQVSTPLTWQARVLAHYLVADREYERIVLIGERRIPEAALAEEGASPIEDAAEAQAVLALKPAPPQGSPLNRWQIGLGSGALGFSTPLPPGTVACAPYTWAGWAEPIPRVARFRQRFSAMFGREPGLAEQEGYEAVRALAGALDRTGGVGGDRLVRELEAFRDETFSSNPIRLGPDDHVFAEQSHLGLFAITRDESAPGEDLDPVPWRPLMRTFTTNGKRVNLADRDVRVFFPNWGPRRPRPNYWRSEYGIVTRPDDPLH